MAKKQTWPKSCCTCTKKHPQGINRKKQHPQGLQRFLTEQDLAQESSHFGMDYYLPRNSNQRNIKAQMQRIFY